MDIYSDRMEDQNQAFALAALLDDEHTAKVHQIWKVLESECDLKPVHVPPYPHFSFHVAQGYQLAELENRLSTMVSEIKPFTIRTTGLSVFTGQNPVVYIPVVGSQILFSVHSSLWEQTSMYGKGVNPYYQPGSWIPHVTVLHDDVDLDCIDCIFDQFIEKTFAWEIEISELAVIYQKNEEYGLHKIFPLLGE